MSIERVTLTGAEERFAPPLHEIDIAFSDGLVFISCYDGSDEDLLEGRKHVYDVPVLKLDDLTAALQALGAIRAGETTQQLLIKSNAPTISIDVDYVMRMAKIAAGETL